MTDQELRAYKTTRQRRGRRIAAGVDPDAPVIPFSLRIRGAKNPNAKLTKKKVIKARRLRKKGETVQLIAKQFGVAQSTMSYALTGRTWGD